MIKVIGLVVLVVIGIGALVFYTSRNGAAPKASPQTSPIAAENSVAQTGTVKEFETTAYYDEKGVWYSLKEMRVQKGDRVRITATNIKGMHDFVIDELGVKQELPLNEKIIIEFTADKTGEFVFYCSKPGHRAKGQWGKLIVE